MCFAVFWGPCLEKDSVLTILIFYKIFIAIFVALEFCDKNIKKFKLLAMKWLKNPIWTSYFIKQYHSQFRFKLNLLLSFSDSINLNI